MMISLPLLVKSSVEEGGRINGGNIYGSSFNEKIIRSWCTLWTPN